MKVIILCGGEGTRLRPYTYDNPKPMLMIKGKPILQYIIEFLKKNGYTEYVLTIGYMKEKIMHYFGDGSNFDVKIQYKIEDEPLGTAGSIKNLNIKNTFMVVMGDALIDFNVQEMIKEHKNKKHIATVGLKKHTTKIEYGVAKTEKGIITQFLEKPNIESMVNTGIYIFEPRIFDFIKEKEDFAKNVFPRLIEKGEKINTFEIKGSWTDIGRKEDYEKLKEEMEK